MVDPLRKKYPRNFKHYMDDLIIATLQGEEELHHQIVHKLLDLLEHHLLFLKLTKCAFKQPKVNFLGIHLGKGVISIDPAKIAGIQDWPESCKTVKEVRSTLGVLGFQ